VDIAAIEHIGVTNPKAYTNFPDLFDGARWIWCWITWC
jgi:hypothetical protein